MTRELILLALLWAAWGALHSVLIARPVQRGLRERLGGAFRYTRLAYNLLALVTFVAVYAYARVLGGPVVFDWWGAWLPVTALFLASALALLWAGARAYDLGAFLGVLQLGHGRHVHGLTETGGLSRAGILGWVRHPWYTAAFLVLWSGRLTAADLVTAIALSLYVLVGTWLEERKLEAEFGEEYRRYRRAVSAYVPWKRLVRAVRG